MRYYLIDRVTSIEVGQRATGVKCVTLTDEVVHDHFPDYPVLPGALILEGASQLAGFLLEVTFNADDDGPLRRALLMQVKDARFYEVSTPGDRLEFTVEVDSLLDAAARVRATVEIEGKRIARALLTFAMKDLDSERVHEQRRYIYRLWTRDLETPPPLR